MIEHNQYTEGKIANEKTHGHPEHFIIIGVCEY
jgi:hypothetical protein